MPQLASDFRADLLLFVTMLADSDRSPHKQVSVVTWALQKVLSLRQVNHASPNRDLVSEAPCQAPAGCLTSQGGVSQATLGTRFLCCCGAKVSCMT